MSIFIDVVFLHVTQCLAGGRLGVRTQLRHTLVVERGIESSSAKRSAVGVSVTGTRRWASSMDSPCHSCCATLKKLYPGMLRQVIKFKTEQGTHALWRQSFRSKWRIYNMNKETVNQIFYRCWLSENIANVKHYLNALSTRIRCL